MSTYVMVPPTPRRGPAIDLATVARSRGGAASWVMDRDRNGRGSGRKTQSCVVEARPPHEPSLRITRRTPALGRRAQRGPIELAIPVLIVDGGDRIDAGAYAFELTDRGPVLDRKQNPLDGLAHVAWEAIRRP